MWINIPGRKCLTWYPVELSRLFHPVHINIILLLSESIYCRWFSICWNRSLYREAHTFYVKHCSVGDMYMAVVSIVFNLAQYNNLGHNLRHKSFVGNWMLSLMFRLHPPVQQTFGVQSFSIVYFCPLKSLKNSVVLLTVNIHCVD